MSWLTTTRRGLSHLIAKTAAALTTAAPIGAAPVGAGGGGWYPIVREPYAGAWQQNVSITPASVLAYHAIYACVTLIAGDIGKCHLRLVQKTDDDIWEDTESPAFSPVLRKPNRYQTINKFLEQWNVSKLTQGNTYVLKGRDRRGVVVALYVLNPSRVKPLVAPDGGVYYELSTDTLAGLPSQVIVPASEIIHDTMIPLFHPLCGVTPIFACGLPALQGLAIEGNSSKFFSNGSRPGGVLSAPGAIGDDTAKRIKTYWETEFSGDNVGRVAILGDGLKYEQLAISAADAQLVEQLKYSAEAVCSCYHVHPYMIGIGPQPPYANVEPIVQLYYAQCLQKLMTDIETGLDDGLGLAVPDGTGVQYGTEFDLDDLIWMDTKTRTEAAQKSSGTLSVNEARLKYFGVGPVEGGDSPMVQQQYYSLEALASRDADDPFAKPAPAAAAPSVTRAAVEAALARIEVSA